VTLYTALGMGIAVGGAACAALIAAFGWLDARNAAREQRAHELEAIRIDDELGGATTSANRPDATP
jgi:hypothetical protein